MFDNEYEEYMRSVLGYPPSENTYYTGQGVFPYRNVDNTKNYSHLYPEIYTKLKPLVAKACNEHRNVNLSEDSIEQITMDIYSNFEAESNSEKTSSSNQQTNVCSSAKNSKNSENSRQNSQNLNANIKQNQNAGESRACKQCNPLLKDLIKILLINQLINNSQNRPQRPPANPYPPRPPRPRGLLYGMENDDIDFY